jgi:hypothetical protein
MSNARIVKAPEPTLGQVSLAQTDAEEIGKLLGQAVYHGTVTPIIEDLYHERVTDARQRFRIMARRLGYELVPAVAREKADA